jgi:hypothetical protein
MLVVQRSDPNFQLPGPAAKRELAMRDSIQASRHRRQQALHPNHPAVIDADHHLKSVEANKRAAFRRKLAEQIDPEPSGTQQMPPTWYPMATPGREPPEADPEPEEREPSEDVRRDCSDNSRSGFLPIAMPRPDPPDIDAEHEHRPNFRAPSNIQVPVPSSMHDDARTEVSDLSYISEFTGLNTLGSVARFRASPAFENPLFPHGVDKSHYKNVKSSIADDKNVTRAVEERSATLNHPRGSAIPIESSPDWNAVLQNVELNSKSQSPECNAALTTLVNTAQPRAMPRQGSPRGRAPRLSSLRKSSRPVNGQYQNSGREGPPLEESAYVSEEETSTECQEPVEQGRLDPGYSEGRPGAMLVQGPPTPRDWRKQHIFAMVKETTSADGTVTIDMTGCEDEDLSTVFGGLQEPIPTHGGNSFQDSLARSRDSTTFFGSLGPGGSPKGHGRPAGMSQRQSPPHEKTPIANKPPNQQTQNDDDSLFNSPYLKGETHPDDTDTEKFEMPCYSLESSIKYLRTVAEDIGTHLKQIQNIVADKDMDGMLEILSDELKKAKESTPEKRDEFVRFLGQELEKTGCVIDRTNEDNDWTAHSQDLINKAKKAFFVKANAKEERKSKRPERFDAIVPTR